jgi:rod shape-determining protein MreD
MRSLFIGVPLLAFFAVLQSTLFQSVSFINGGFDFVLVIVLAWNLARREIDAPIWGFVGGLFADILSGGTLGAATFAVTVVALLVAITEGNFFKANAITAMLVTVIGTIWYHLLYLFIISLNGHIVQWADAITLITLPSALLNLILIVPAYYTARWLVQLISPKEIGIAEK